jgi:hypothetical protein
MPQIGTLIQRKVSFEAMARDESVCGTDRFGRSQSESVSMGRLRQRLELPSKARSLLRLDFHAIVRLLGEAETSSAGTQLVKE